MSTPKPVLITGASGYIGSALVSMLKFLKQPFKAYDIVAGPDVEGKHIFQLKEKDFENVSRVIHLAAIVGTKECEKNEDAANKVNLEGTMRLCELARGIPIYFTNTNIGYPKGKSDETAPLKSENAYAKTKIVAETYILAAGGISFRLASVFGVSPKMRNDLVLHYLVDECVNKKEIDLYDADSSRNFIHLRDVLRVLSSTDHAFKAGQAYNIAIEKHITKRQIVKRIERYIGEIKKNEVKDQTDPDKRDYELSVEKAKSAGFYPMWTIEDELPNLISYYETKPLQNSKRQSL